MKDSVIYNDIKFNYVNQCKILDECTIDYECDDSFPEFDVGDWIKFDEDFNGNIKYGIITFIMEMEDIDNFDYIEKYDIYVFDENITYNNIRSTYVIAVAQTEPIRNLMKDIKKVKRKKDMLNIVTTVIEMVTNKIVNWK